MSQTMPMAKVEKISQRFVLEMRGFTDAERSMLASTFRLTSRREMCYVEPNQSGERPDIYLVNGDNPEAVQELAKRDIGVPNAHSPAVVVGKLAVETNWPFVTKPIHWMRLFENLDSEMQRALLERKQRDEQSPVANPNWDGASKRRLIDQLVAEENADNVAPQRESVLVVDDSATVRAFMRIKLADFQFDVDFAETGEQAIEKASKKNFTCIFLDIMMPGIDGYEVCKRIKTKAHSKKTAVVMLTSKSSMIDKFRGTWSGCDAYLNKPVSEDELLATIAKFLPSSRVEKPLA